MQQLIWFDRVVDNYTEARSTSAPPLRVMVFEEREEFEKIFNQRHFAAFTQPELSRTTLVVGPDHRDQALANTLHEYVHYRLRTQSRSYPMWYEEGLATILATTKFEQRGEEVVSTTSHRLPTKFTHVSLPRVELKELVTTTNIDDWSHRKIGGFYKHSAQLTRFLLHAEHIGQAPLTTALHAHLQRRTDNLFAALRRTPEELNSQLKQFNQAKDKPAYSHTAPASLIQPIERRLSSQQVGLMHAQTAESSNPRYAARRYKRLLKSDPENPQLWSALAAAQRSLDPKRSAQSLLRAQRLDPTHPEVLLQTALQDLAACPLDRSLVCLDDWQDVTLILRQVLQQNPDHYQAILWLGVTELYSGNPGGARNYLTIAYQRAPWAPRVNYLLGEALRLLGNPRARQYLTRAKLWAYDPQLRSFADASLGLLPQLEIGS